MACTAFFFYPKWEKPGAEATISWDVSGYYMYLPASFIYKDLKHCGFKDSIVQKYAPAPGFGQAFIHASSGNYVMKYSSGQAVVMAPFFFIAHSWATHSSRYPPDGFSFPYQFCIGVGMFLYALIGLFFLRRVLLEYFKDSTVAVLLIAYVFGTNYLNYSCIDQAMVHNVLFTIYTVVIYLTIRFYKAPQNSTALLIGLLIGLAALIRPTEIILVLIPAFWNIETRIDWKARLAFANNHIAKLVLFALGIALVGSVQLFYWKYVSGDWLVYSYGKYGFSWWKPHIKDYIFSYRCGWLRYCHMMFFAVFAIIPYFRYGRHRLAVFSFIFITFYLVTAWDVWDYGGTAGRAMVQSYTILAFPFAWLIERVNQRKWLSAIFYPLFILCIYLNIWWTYQVHKGSIQIMRSNKQYYWNTLGRWTPTEEDSDLLNGK
jgi:hypothetical protein